MQIVELTTPGFGRKSAYTPTFSFCSALTKPNEFVSAEVGSESVTWNSAS
jgi:hypothetical protein